MNSLPHPPHGPTIPQHSPILALFLLFFSLRTISLLPLMLFIALLCQLICYLTRWVKEWGNVGEWEMHGYIHIYSISLLHAPTVHTVLYIE
jgi:hypothetical protein